MIPKIVKIGALDYKIIESSLVHDLPEMYKMGEIDYTDSKIYIDTELHNRVKRNTLLHEIVHGMLNDSGHLVERDNEGLVSALAGQLHSLIRENPSLIEYIKAKDNV